MRLEGAEGGRTEPPDKVTTSVMADGPLVRYSGQGRQSLPNPGKEGGCGG